MPLKVFKQGLKPSLESPTWLCCLACAVKLSVALGKDVSRSVPALQINPFIYGQGERTILSGFIKAQLLFNPVLQNPKVLVGFVGKRLQKHFSGLCWTKGIGEDYLKSGLLLEAPLIRSPGLLLICLHFL